MAVEIPISANPAPAQAAMRRLLEEFRRLNQQAQEFAKTDFSKVGGDLQKQLEQIQRNFQDLLNPRLGSGLSRRTAETGQQGRAPWELDWNRLYPHDTAEQLARRQQQFFDRLFAQTDWTPPSRPTGHPGGAGGDAGGGRGAGRDAGRGAGRGGSSDEESHDSELARFGSTLLGGMKFGAGLLGIQTGLRGINDAYQGAHAISRYTDEFMRRTQDVGHDFAFLRQQITQVGQGMGVASDEAAKLTLAFTRTAHAATLEDATRGANTALGLAYSFGADKEQTVQQMGRLNLIGAAGGTLSPNQKRFAAELGLIVSKSNVPLETGLANISRLAEASAQRTAAEPPTQALTGYLEALYGQAQTNKGLRGEAGISLLTQADAALANTDNPAANLAFFQGLSPLMGTTNYLEILKQRQKGGLAPVLNRAGEDTGETNLSVLLAQYRKNLGNVDPLYLAAYLDKDLGFNNLNRTEQLIAIQDARQGRGGVGSYLNELKQRNIDINTVDDTAFKDLADILGQSTDPKAQFAAALKKFGPDFTTVKPMTDVERNRLNELKGQALAGGDQEQKIFVDQLVDIIRTHGGKTTPYTQMENQLAEIKSALIDKVGTPIEHGFSMIAMFLQKQFGFTPETTEAQARYRESQVASRTTAQEANDALLAAQTAVAQAPPGSSEQLKALANLQQVYESQKKRVQATQQETDQAWQRQAGWPRGTLGGAFLEAFGIIGPAQSPAEKAFAQQPAPDELFNQERRRVVLARAQGATSREEMLKALEEIERQRTAGSSAPPPETHPSIRPLVEPERRAQGGPIGGGYGGGDRIPALLEAGEFVINKVDSQKHRGLLEQINRGAITPVRRAEGGTIPQEALPNASLAAPDSLNADSPTDAVKELKKRTEQLFDPVTRYLEMIAKAVLCKAGHGQQALPAGFASGILSETHPLIRAALDSAPGGPLEETHPLIRAALDSAASQPGIDSRFIGEGLGYLSSGNRYQPGGTPEGATPTAGALASGSSTTPTAGALASGSSTTPTAGATALTGIPNSAPSGGALPTTAEGLRFKNRAEATGGGKTHAATYALAHHLQAQYPEFDRITGMDDLYHHSEAYKAKKRAQGLSPNSVHTTGRALDFTINDPKKSAEVAQRLRNELKQAGVNASIVDEYRKKTAGGTGGHLHVNFASEQDAQKYLAASSANHKPVAPADSTGTTRGSSGPIPKNQWAEKGAELAQYYKKRLGLTDYQAAALAGNAIHESSLNTKAVGDKTLGDSRSAHGLFQWREERWQRLQEYAQKTGRPSDDWNVQKEFAAVELETSKSKALKNLKQTKNAADASRVINQQYEVSADKVGGGADMNRIRHTQAVMDEMGSDPTPRPDAPPAYTPLPDPAPLDSQSQSKGADSRSERGIGQLDITIRQQDPYGARIGQDVAHVMNLRAAKPHGAVTVDAVNRVG